MSHESEERVVDDDFSLVVSEPTQDVPSNTQLSLGATCSEPSSSHTDNPDLVTMGAASSGFIGELFVTIIEKFSTPGASRTATVFILTSLGISSVHVSNKIFTEFTDIGFREFFSNHCEYFHAHPFGLMTQLGILSNYAL